MTDQRKELVKAHKALEVGKLMEAERNKNGIKTVKIPNGVRGEIFAQAIGVGRGRNLKSVIDHAEVLRLLGEGLTQTQVGNQLRISKQMISYIYNKNKNFK